MLGKVSLFHTRYEWYEKVSHRYANIKSKYYCCIVPLCCWMNKHWFCLNWIVTNDSVLRLNEVSLLFYIIHYALFMRGFHEILYFLTRPLGSPGEKDAKNILCLWTTTTFERRQTITAFAQSSSTRKRTFKIINCKIESNHTASTIQPKLTTMECLPQRWFDFHWVLLSVFVSSVCEFIETPRSQQKQNVHIAPVSPSRQVGQNTKNRLL